jgi:hypothetical protein
VSTEPFIQNLFKKLAFPLIHWFSSGQQMESREASAVIGSIMDGLCSAETSLQDVSADCFAEFFLWYIRSSNEGQAKGLLKRIVSYARHPDSSKRFAAAFAFNRVYKFFREKPDLGKSSNF